MTCQAFLLIMVDLATVALVFVGLNLRLGSRQFDQLVLDVWIHDRAPEGAKPALARRAGANYLHEDLAGLLRREPPDIVLECTGADSLVLEVIRANAPGAVTCLFGVSAAGRKIPVDVGSLNRGLVLENDVIFGSVNANRRHYEQAAAALAVADTEWLAALITRRVPLVEWPRALHREPDEVKVVIDVAV